MKNKIKQNKIKRISAFVPWRGVCDVCNVMCEDRRESCMWNPKDEKTKERKWGKNNQENVLKKEKENKLFYKINTYNMFDFLIFWK